MKFVILLITGTALGFAAAANLDLCSAVHGPGASENDFDLVVSGLSTNVCTACQTSITTRAAQRGIAIESFTCSPTADTSATFDILLNGGTAGSESFFQQRNVILASLIGCANATTGDTCTCTGC